LSAAVINENTLEETTLKWFQELGFAYKFGPDIAPEEPASERSSFSEVILKDRLQSALSNLNSHLPPDAIEEAFRKITRPELPSPIQNNRTFHQMLVNGVEVEYRHSEGRVVGDRARLIDFDNPEANDWLVVNQFTVIEGDHNRRPDIVVFVNGLPVSVIELKNPTDEEATIWSAFNQLQTYKKQISSLFVFNEILVISDGLQARFGSLTANKEWYLPWRTIEGDETAPATQLQLEVMIRGMFEKNRFLDYLRHFIVFEEEADTIIKKLAGYHQFHAVRNAVEETIRATRPKGDKKCGVVWHTQGSGKSLTMTFYAGRVILTPEMENPTIVVITDRNDLDDQLFGTFSRCHQLLRQRPVQAEGREDLKEKLRVASGGVIFTTIQKFSPDLEGGEIPMLSDRNNIVVIADEAHRSQYGFAAKLQLKTGKVVYGLAQYMRNALPNASFIGFTGTPIELTDKNTQAVFGEYVSIYDIQQAVVDGATVPIYYESRLAKLELDNQETLHLDEEFEEVTEGEETGQREMLKTKWAALEALVGTEKRLHLVAKDLVKHFEQRQEGMDGKAMVVCMSRKICVALYNEIIKLRPDWQHDDNDKGLIKVVMTGSASDPLDWQPHIRNKPGREKMAKRFKDASDGFKIVIVRDMWLTGFDCPSLHTLYADKPMQSHGLMQAIARVNRVFKDKPGGLVVDYLGLADQLKEALANYTNSGGKGKTAIDINEAVAVMLEKLEICRGLFHNFDYSNWTSEGLTLLPLAQEHILAQEDGKSRLIQVVTLLSKAFALAVPHESALEIREEIGFFQAIRAALIKSEPGKEKTQEEMEHAIRQLVSKAVTSDQVVDIFAAAGLDKPDISILSDEFLAEVRDLPQKNLAVELLRKLLNNEIKTKSRRNLIQGRSFKELLENSIRKYQNRAIETAKVIEELIQLAKDMNKAHQRGEDLGMSEDELAFYDSLEVNDSAVKVLGDEILKTIALELVDKVKKNTTIDWMVKQSARAKLRVLVKKILRKYGYPPDKQEQATQTVLEQAELLCHEWAA
jgi:type I restriction enzyme, R subunit